MHNPKQLIRSPTRVAKTTSTLLGHILTHANEMVSHPGVLDIGLSDHKLVFCKRRKQKSKLYKHKTIKRRSLKKYSADKLCDKLKYVNFANYSEFDDANNAFVDFSDFCRDSHFARQISILIGADGPFPGRLFTEVLGKNKTHW